MSESIVKMTSNKLANDENRTKLMKKVKDISNLLAYMDDDSKIPFISNSLTEIATLVYLASSDKDCSELSEKLIMQICSIVFNFKTKPYDSFLTVNDDAENSEFPNWALLEFFQKMHALLQTSDYVFGTVPGTKACAAFMKRIMFEIFKEKRSDMEPLKILSLFCAMSGVDIPLLVTANSCCDKIFKDAGKKPDINIMSLNYILEGCCGCSHYFNLTTVPDGLLAPSDWLEGLMFVLLDVHHEKNQSTWLKCFRSLLKMSLSVVEKHLTTIIKSTLLKINMDDADSKKDYCDLFIDLISLYSRLHQLPKFFVKLLLALTECIQEGSLGEYICKGQIFPVVLNSVALHSQELPFGQIMEQWKIFSETYTTFGNMTQVFTKGKGAVFFVSQLFATFLMHCKLFDFTVPDAIYEKFGDLILHTRKELKKNISILSDRSKEVLPLQRSLLLLCFALGEVKLTYNDCHEEPLNDDLILRFSDHACDCTLFLKFLSEEHCEIFDSWLKGEDKVLSFLVFQLLVQKVRGLLHKKELSNEENAHLHKTLSFILEHAKENIIYGDTWDTDLGTLYTNNYGCAIWRILLKYFPLIVNSVDIKELINICGCFRDVILQQQSSSSSLCEMDLKAVILSEVQSVYFQESKNFQAAVLASVWKLDGTFLQKKRSHDEIDSDDNLLNILSQLNIFRNKWTKYAESNPKSNQDETLNSLWHNVKDTCTLLNQILQSESIIKPKMKAEVYNILQLIECLPLEYLLPGNQVKCIVGLSVLFFLTPESCNSHEARNVAEKIAKLLIAIFDAVRSIWFFDFVNSGFYLREVVNTLERLMTMKAIDETSEWPKLLLHSLVRLILKRRESLIAMENFFSELNVVEETAEFSCLVLLLTLEQVSQIFKKVHLPDDYKESCENLASSLCSSCVKAVKKTEEGYSVSVYCTLIECYAEVIKILTSTSCNIDQKKKERYLKPLPKIITIAKENISNPKNNAYFKFFASICEHSKDIESFIPDDFHLIIWSNVHILFQQQCLNPTALQQSQNILHPVTLQNNEIKLLNSLFTLMSKEDTDKILEELLKQMENIDLVFLNAFTLQMNLNIIKQIIDSDSKRPESSLPTTILVNILSQLCRISLNKSSDTDFHIHMIKIPILQFINFLLKLKKSCIPRQHLVQSLSACRVSKFPKDSNSFSLFLNEFDAVFDVCYSLLVYHSEVVFNATFSFLQTVILLLRSLIAAGSQDHIAKQEKTVHLQIIQAAQNMDRLFTVMSRHKTNFAKLASYLIAEYVDCVQHITLDGNVKDHLLLGMYRLLDLCSEDTLKSVSVNINHSCRDIFINVMKNYKQLKYRGDV
ncbi:uncharacterized protein LOC129969411 [Argiope bruennichi]|uniref:uncharacterized protein LOC129969411 n=1 Tax=Argiope bruennichi TaxID=94029 RepID=UPI002494B94B|nr:uncharacterized protein LOC129969411 [Argiope bruennichi]